MAKIWEGRLNSKYSKEVDEFNSSISFDHILYKYDIKASIAHVNMLATQNIISEKDKLLIVEGLESVLEDINTGKLKIDFSSEDIHMFIEEELTKRVGDIGKKVHTARSRNDQIAQDIKLYLIDESNEIKILLKDLINTFINLAKNNSKTIMSGFTHLQKAQPITFAHYILSYAFSFERDMNKLINNEKYLKISPIGSCALAGTTFNIDNLIEAKELGFNSVVENSIDGVSDRDYILDMAYICSLISLHMSRLCEELIIWVSDEYKYIEIADDFSTGSSIMPQKKNPDILELIRGKTGRIYGNLFALFTMMKSLPLSYNKDMQEDKISIFETITNIKKCLSILNKLVASLKINIKNMRNSAESGYINATDLADYLVIKGKAFRDAYKISGLIVKYAIENNKSLNSLKLSEFRKYSDLIDKDIYEYIDIENATFRRKSDGGPSIDSVTKQISILLERLKNV